MGGANDNGRHFTGSNTRLVLEHVATCLGEDAIADSPAAGEVIHSLVHLGKALGLETLAEGIEHREQFDHLHGEGCDSGQGFMFARPLEPAALVVFLEEHQVDVAGTLSETTPRVA